jgi:hypothetical protein
MDRPPIADPTGEPFPTPFVKPTQQHVALAQGLNRAAFMSPVWLFFFVWDLVLMAAVSEFAKGAGPNPFAVDIFVFALTCLLLVTRFLLGLRLGRGLEAPIPILMATGIALPVISPFVLISLHGRAAIKLRAAGIKAGLFGVPAREMAKLRALAAEGPREH